MICRPTEKNPFMRNSSVAGSRGASGEELSGHERPAEKNQVARWTISPG